MSEWVKISDADGGTFAQAADPVAVLTVAEIEAEIKELQDRINSFHLIEIPKDASNEIKEAINYKNGMLLATEIVPIQNQLEQKQLLLSEIING